MKALIIDAKREEYSIFQIRWTLTVGELKDLLEEYDDETPIYLSHDDGYTYGGISSNGIEEIDTDDNDEE